MKRDRLQFAFETRIGPRTRAGDRCELLFIIEEQHRLLEIQQRAIEYLGSKFDELSRRVSSLDHDAELIRLGMPKARSH